MPRPSIRGEPDLASRPLRIHDALAASRERDSDDIAGGLAIDKLRVKVVDCITDRSKSVVGSREIRLLLHASPGLAHWASTASSTSAGAPRLSSVERMRKRQKKGRDRRVEDAAIGSVHLIRPAHLAAMRGQLASARVLEVLARTQGRLTAHDARTAHFFDLADPIGDDPMASHEPCRLDPFVRDPHRVRKSIATRMPSVTAVDVSVATICQSLAYRPPLAYRPRSRSRRPGGRLLPRAMRQ